MAYCNTTTDLTDQYPDFSRYLEKRILENWYATSGQSNTYECRGVGQVNLVFDDGEQLTAKTSIATVEAAAGSYWYNSDVNIVYVHAKGSDDLTSASITIEAGDDWDALLTRINNRMYNFINNILSNAYPTPIPPRIRRIEGTDDYDYVLIKCNALLTIAEVMRRRKTDDPESDRIYRMVWNTNPQPEEQKGILNQLIDGDIQLTDQITAKEAGFVNYWPYASNVQDTPIWIYGTYTGDTYQRWKLEFDTAGATGTATFKLSRDGGTNWDMTLQDTFDSDSDDRRMSLQSGLYAVFDPDTNNTYGSGDYWTIEVFPVTDEVGVQKIGNARAYR